MFAYVKEYIESVNGVPQKQAQTKDAAKPSAPNTADLLSVEDELKQTKQDLSKLEKGKKDLEKLLKETKATSEQLKVTQKE